ncbi:MAG: hydroxyisourate hydrolase [Acidobacteriota bacterium]
MARLSTHVLDTAHGVPAAGVHLTLHRVVDDGDDELVAERITNSDGRTDLPLLSGDAIPTGRYRITFHAGDYFRGRGIALPDPPFVEVVQLHFGIADAAGHYHVPLLVSPWSYSTYRGS